MSTCTTPDKLLFCTESAIEVEVKVGVGTFDPRHHDILSPPILPGGRVASAARAAPATVQGTTL